MVWSAYLVGFGLLAQNGGSLLGRAERLVADNLATLLNAKPTQVEVTIRPDSLHNLLAGRLGSVDVQAEKFAVEAMPLVCDPQTLGTGSVRSLQIAFKDFHLRRLPVVSLVANVPDCRFDLAEAKNSGQVRFRSSGEGRGVVTTNADSVAAYAKARFPSLDKVTVKFLNGWVVLEATGTLLWAKADLWVSGQLRANGKRQIVLVPRRFLVNGKRLDEQQTAIWLQPLTPLIDLDRDLGLNGAMDVSSVDVSRNRVAVSGVVRIPTVSQGVSLPHGGGDTERTGF